MTLSLGNGEEQKIHSYVFQPDQSWHVFLDRLNSFPDKGILGETQEEKMQNKIHNVLCSNEDDMFLLACLERE